MVFLEQLQNTINTIYTDNRLPTSPPVQFSENAEQAPPKSLQKAKETIHVTNTIVTLQSPVNNDNNVPVVPGHHTHSEVTKHSKSVGRCPSEICVSHKMTVNACIAPC